MENIQEPTWDDGKKKINWIVIALAVLAVAFAVSLYFNYSQRQDRQFVRSELNSAYQELETMKSELEAKIAEIEKLGGDVQELRQVKEQMDAEMNELRSQNQIAWANYKKIQDRVEGYRELLVLKDKEIERLKSVNQELLTENITLKDEKNILFDSISSLAQSRSKLEERVELASRLKAENIKVYAVNKKGKEKEGEFRNSQLDHLKVDFTIAENNVAPIEGKEILIRIREPEGNVLFDVARGSGTFMFNGREEFYTAKQEILFDNTRQRLTFTYDKGSDFVEGKHTVEIYTDGYIMGSESFVVK